MPPGGSDRQHERNHRSHQGSERDQQDDEGQPDRHERPVESAADQVRDVLARQRLAHRVDDEPALVGLDRGDRRADRDRMVPDGRLVTVDAGDNPDGRTVRRTRNASRGAVRGSWTSSIAGTVCPPASTVSAASWATTCPTNAWNPGRSRGGRVGDHDRDASDGTPLPRPGRPHSPSPTPSGPHWIPWDRRPGCRRSPGSG